MPLFEVAILFFISGLVLLAADVFVPSHGVLTSLALLCVGAGVVTCFRIDQYVGLTAFLLSVAAAPFGAWMFVKYWPRSWVGRRICLAEVPPDSTPVPAPLGTSIGDIGRTISELRPIGEADFHDRRVEVRSELGIVKPDVNVRVVAIAGGLPVVREVEM